MTSISTNRPHPTPLMSARSLVRGQGHPSQRLGVGAALTAHLAASAWLQGRFELMAPAAADPEIADHLLQRLGPLTQATHPHGPHTRVRLTSSSVVGLGPLRAARLG